MSAPIRIMLVGGGSGGHFYPLMSIAETLRSTEENVDLYYIGPDPYDERILQTHQIRFVSCPAGKQRRYASILNILDLFKAGWGSLIALIKLYTIYPDVVVSKGGYTSVPVILAAAFLNIPIVVHESDTRPGKANKLAAVFAEKIAISFEEVRPFFKHPDVVTTGIPIRRELLQPSQRNIDALLTLNPNKPVILVLGGSQGAERINQLILDSLDELLGEYSIIHQTGKSNFEVTSLSARSLIQDDTLFADYHPIAFFDDPAVLNAAYHRASLIISRAGSTSIYETALHGKPAILIPIPEAVSHDQRTNAYAYARLGAAVVLEEANLTDSLLTSEISRIMNNPEIGAQMSAQAAQFAPHDAGERIASMVTEIAHTH